MTCPLRIGTKELSVYFPCRYLVRVKSTSPEGPLIQVPFGTLAATLVRLRVGILAVAHNIKCESRKCILKGFDSSKHWGMETHVKYRWILFEGQKWPGFPDWLGEGTVRILGFLCVPPPKKWKQGCKKKKKNSLVLKF